MEPAKTKLARKDFPTPSTVLGGYRLLADKKDYRGIGVELRRGDIFYSHARKEIHGSEFMEDSKRKVLVFQQHSKINNINHQGMKFESLATKRPIVNATDNEAIAYNIANMKSRFADNPTMQ